MTHIGDILNGDLYAEQKSNGNIRLQTHPEFPELVIANYTEQAAFNRDWNDVTRTCRGLIWNTETGEVLARPFPKFFNFDEKEAPRILDDQVVWHYDNKYDGSLGIMYECPDGDVRIATRGSFASDQAILGTDLLKWHTPKADYHHYVFMLASGYTPLFEICGPDNRIVLQYDENFLALLGYMHIETGMFVPPSTTKGMGRTMRDCLMDLSRSNAEGWVVWKSSFEAVKIKQADYIELHRIVSNLSKKEVWRQLRAGTFYDFKLKLPDEWHAWATEIADDLRDQFVRTYNLADTMLHMMNRDYGKNATRKEQAFWINDKVIPEIRGLVFNLLDGKDIEDAIWRQLEPRGDE